MKVYTEIVIDIGSGEVVGENFTIYHGPVSLAKGSSAQKGGGTTNTTTTNVNPTADRLAGIGEQFLSPALQGQSFSPVTGVRDMVQQQLMPLIPLMQKQLMGENGQGGVFGLPGQISGHRSLSPLAQDMAMKGGQFSEQHLRDVFRPVDSQGQQLFQQAVGNLVPQVRSGLATRGIASGGVGQGIEDKAVGDLAFQFGLRENDFRNQVLQQRLQALQQFGSAKSGITEASQADLSERLQKTGGELSAITGGQSALARGFQLPLDVLNQAIGTELAPFQALMQLTGASAGGTNVQTTSGATNQSQKSTSPTGIFGK